MLRDKVGVKINSQVALCELVQYNLLVYELYPISFEKARKEDRTSTREAVSPRIETLLSIRIRLCSVCISQSISNIFEFVKGTISNFVRFSFILKYQHDNEAVSCHTICHKLPRGKKDKKVGYTFLDRSMRSVYNKKQGGTVCLTIALPRRCLSFPWSST
jgi:hypothetical protein